MQKRLLFKIGMSAKFPRGVWPSGQQSNFPDTDTQLILSDRVSTYTYRISLLYAKLESEAGLSRSCFYDLPQI